MMTTREFIRITLKPHGASNISAECRYYSSDVNYDAEKYPVKKFVGSAETLREKIISHLQEKGLTGRLNNSRIPEQHHELIQEAVDEYNKETRLKK